MSSYHPSPLAGEGGAFAPDEGAASHESCCWQFDSLMQPPHPSCDASIAIHLLPRGEKVLFFVFARESGKRKGPVERSEMG